MVPQSFHVMTGNQPSSAEHQNRCKGIRDNINVQNVKKNSNMNDISLVMPAFLKKSNCEKHYTRLNHFHTHLSNCSKQPAKQMKTLTLLQNSHINDHDGDHYTADKEDQLLTLSMLQEKFQMMRQSFFLL